MVRTKGGIYGFLCPTWVLFTLAPRSSYVITGYLYTGTDTGIDTDTGTDTGIDTDTGTDTGIDTDTGTDTGNRY